MLQNFWLPIFNFTRSNYLDIIMALIITITLMLCWIVYFLYKRNTPLKRIEKKLENDIEILKKEKVKIFKENLEEIENIYYLKTKEIHNKIVVEFTTINKNMQIFEEKSNKLSKEISQVAKNNTEYIELVAFLKDKYTEVFKDRENKSRYIFKLKKTIKEYKKNNKNIKNG